MYILTDNGVITPQGTHVPNDSNNRHWIEYQDWLSKGGIPIAKQPSKYHVLNEYNIWVGDLERWLDGVIRPERNKRMDEVDRRIARYHRQVRLGYTPKDDLASLDNLNQQLADFPNTFTDIVDTVVWPK